MSETVQPRPNPYVGPRAFQRGEALFGRDHEVLRLLDLLLAERIVLLYSPSGAGKTSLVEAALIPKLESRRFRVLPTMRVGLAPAETLPVSANRYVLSLLLSLEENLPSDQQTPLAELASLTLAEYLDRQPATGEGPDRIALIVDQFEEILTLNPADRAAKAEFFAQVGEALEHPRRWALFALREEFVAGLDPYLNALPTRLSTRYRLELLGLDAAKEAMQRPARAAGVEFSDGAAEQLVRNLAMMSVQQPDGSTTPVPGDSVEPVQLQVVCRRLWDRLPAGHAKIGLGNVEDVGDVDTALGGYYAERVAAIAAATSVPERAIREWVDRQLITEQGIRGQVLQGLDQSQGLDNRAIWLLEDAHLVRAEKRRGATWFELAHDRLIEPVRRDNAQWRAAKLNTLQRKAGLWNSAQRPDGLLLRGQELAEAKRWAIGHTRELENFEHDFLTRSQERHKVETRQKILVVALAVMFILAVVAAIFSGIQAGIARQQQATAVAALDMVATSDSKVRDAELALAAEILRDDAAGAQATADQLRQTLEAVGTPMTMTVEQRQTVEVLQVAATAAQAEADQLRGTAEAASTAAVAAQQTAEAEGDRVIGPKVDPRIQSLLTLDLKGSVYKLEEIIWMDPDESLGLHHILVDVVDSDGRRLAGEKVRVSWPGGEDIIPIEERLGEPWGGNFAMYATLGSYAVEVVAASGASDKVAGLGMGTPQQPTAKYYTSFGLRFVRPKPTPLPSDTPTATPSLTPTPSPTATNTPRPTRARPSPTPTLAPPPAVPTLDATRGRIACVSWQNEERRNEIVIMDGLGAQQTRLTYNDIDELDLALSADGRFIVFAAKPSTSNPDSDYEIYVMTSGGGGINQLTSSPGQDRWPAFAPDGKTIVFASSRDRQDGKELYQIYLMDADGRNQRRLSRSGASDRDPAFSPDGRQVVFVSDRDGNDELYIMDVDGQNVRRLTNSPGNDWGPSFSPDGLQVLYYFPGDGNEEIYLLDLINLANTRLTKNPKQDRDPAFSPDGREIVYVYGEKKNNDWQLWVMNRDGSGAHQLTYGLADYHPAWSVVPPGQ